MSFWLANDETGKMAKEVPQTGPALNLFVRSSMVTGSIFFLVHVNVDVDEKKRRTREKKRERSRRKEKKERNSLLDFTRCVLIGKDAKERNFIGDFAPTQRSPLMLASPMEWTSERTIMKFLH